MPDNVVGPVVGAPGEPRGERCKTHNLAVGPGGLCVLCRQNARASKGRTGAILLAVGTVSVVAIAIGLAKRFVTPPERAGAETRGRQTGPSEQDLLLALRRVNITMYATTWCPVCAQARQWLRQNDIRYTELDVEANPEAKRVQKTLNPEGSVPTFDIDGAVHVGFSPEGMEDELRSAAQKRARQF